jgi:putative flippase GtrA
MNVREARCSQLPVVTRLLARVRRLVVSSTGRYAAAGAVVGGVNLAVPLMLNAEFGVPIEVAIPIGYLLAILLHFNLQRRFVFRHVGTFALAGRQQAVRYLVIIAVQYPTVAIATALVPTVVAISRREAYVATVATVTVLTYLVLRSRVFHPAEETPPDLPS